MHATQLTEEHQAFREILQAFIRKEILPNIDTWEQQGQIDRKIWKKMGDIGFTGINYPQIYGGTELDFYYAMIFCEEISKCFSGGFSIATLVIQFMSAPYLLKHGSEDLKQRYLKPVILGDMVSAVAITEPGAGSDIQNITTYAERFDDHFIVNGSKTFITNGYYGDFFITAVKTDSRTASREITLLLIDRNAQGVQANKIRKMGLYASDTAEIAFRNVKVPLDNIIGLQGEGFKYLMDGLQLERLTTAIYSLSMADSALQYTLDYVQKREAFGHRLQEFQVLRHRIAQMVADLETCRAYVHHCSDLQHQGAYAVKECSIAKLQASELAIKIVHQCLQLFGGYGFTEDYKIARLYRDVRVGTIIAGTSEIMLEIIAKMEIDRVEYDSKNKSKSSGKTHSPSW